MFQVVSHHDLAVVSSATAEDDPGKTPEIDSWDNIQEWVFSFMNDPPIDDADTAKWTLIAAHQEQRPHRAGRTHIPKRDRPPRAPL